METRPFAEFTSLVHHDVVAQRVPFSITIEVTRRCPLTCTHCYNNLPMDDLEARTGELSGDEIKRIIDESVDRGALFLLFSGGEIFARRDFLDLYTHAKRKGLLITLFTNGTMITKSVADYLEEWPPFAIEITLYGFSREIYEAVTGIPGSWAKCLRGIQLLMERKLPLKLKTVALSINKHEIPLMKKFAEEELGVEFAFDAMINPRIDCSQSPLAVRLTPREVVELDIANPDRFDEYRVFAAEFTGPVHQKGQEDELYHCGGGISSFAIDPSGKMSICVLSHFESYDVREGSVNEGWDQFLHDVRGRRITRPTKCVSCEIKAICGMCPANGELENQDPEAPVEYLCHVAHLRAEVLDVDVPDHGECEYCAGGSAHESLAADAAWIRSGEFLSRMNEPLVMTPRESSGSSCSSGSCGGCAT